MKRLSVKSILSDLRVNPQSWTVNTDTYGSRTLFVATDRWGRTFSRTVNTEYYLNLLRNE